MPYRFRQWYPDANDVIDPHVLNRNFGELAEGMNGGMTQDNLRTGAVTEAMIKSVQFNRLYVDAYDQSGATNRFDADMNRIDWQGTAGGVTLGEIEFTLPVDSLLICEWSGHWYWNGAIAAINSGNEDVVRFRVTLDGVPVCESGFLSIGRQRECCYIVGATPAAPGVRTVRVELQVANMSHTNWIMQPYLDAFYGTQLEVNDRELIVHARMR